MPIYEYECRFCSHRFQILQGFNDPPPSVCPNCHREGGIRKVVSQTSFMLKGSGWYATDYKKSDSSSAKSDGEPKKAESKSEKAKEGGNKE